MTMTTTTTRFPTQAYPWLGDLDVARAMYRTAVDALVLEPHAALALRFVDQLGAELEHVA